MYCFCQGSRRRWGFIMYFLNSLIAVEVSYPPSLLHVLVIVTYGKLTINYCISYTSRYEKINYLTLLFIMFFKLFYYFRLSSFCHKCCINRINIHGNQIVILKSHIIDTSVIFFIKVYI